MWWKTVLLCPFCDGDCARPADRLAGRHVARCGRCGRLVSRSACRAEKRAMWE